MSKEIDPFALSAGVPPEVGASVSGELQPKPKASIGMSKAVVVVLMVFAVLVVFIFFASLEKVEDKSSSKPDSAKKSEKKEVPTVSAVPQDILNARPDFSVLTTKKNADTTGDPVKIEEIKGGVEQKNGVLVGQVDQRKGFSGKEESKISVGEAGAIKVPVGRTEDRKVLGGKADAQMVPSVSQVPQDQKVLSPEEQRVLFLKEEREKRRIQARTDGMDVKGFPKDQANALAPVGQMGLPDAGRGVGSGSEKAGGGAVKPAANSATDQGQKKSFIQEASNQDTDNHKYAVKAKSSDYELNAGTFIPAILEMAINSDMPGLVTARVRENVFDSVTGKYLLIPSTAKLIGSYDSRVALGQNRQLVVWNQIIFPDGSRLNLAGMSSADVSGQSGLEADVDNHYLRLTGVTLGISLLTAGAQMMIPNQPATTAAAGTVAPVLSSQQILSMALAQQFGTLGSQVLGKYLQVQPTLRNVPGERFNLVVPKNIVFPGVWYRGAWVKN